MTETNTAETQCDICQKTFSNPDALSMHRKAKHPETKPIETGNISLFKKKGLLVIILLIGIVGIALAWGFLSPKNNETISPYNTEGMSFPTGNVHWHADLKASVCGEPYIIPNAPVVDHLLHTHEDQRIHVEGAATTPEQITLGKFIQRLGTTFNANEFNGKKIGDMCPNGEKITKMTFLVNGKENTEFENRVIRDGELYEIILNGSDQTIQ